MAASNDTNGITLALVALVSGCTGTTGEPVGTSAGRLVFSNTCADSDCHGADGVSGPAPDLDQVIPELSDAQIEAIVENGVGDAETGMPPQELSAQEIDDLLLYLRQRLRGASDEGGGGW